MGNEVEMKMALGCAHHKANDHEGLKIRYYYFIPIPVSDY